MYTLTEDDKAKIAEYRSTKLGKYPKPSVTVDIIAVRPSYGELTDSQWRENPKFGIEILLIKRGQWPHEGTWALPGGFIHEGESVEKGAFRELLEETSLVAKRLIPVGVFSDPGRDMRTWVISNAFVSVHKPEDKFVKGGDDAAEAKWFRIENPEIRDGSFKLPFFDGSTEVFTLRGTYNADEFGGGTVTNINGNPLAFDHAKIIVQAFLHMLSLDLRKLVFFFLPDKFTLSDYIGVYQYLTNNSIEFTNIPNFRRQLTQTKDPILEVCPGEFEDLDGRGHAAAKLYRRRK